MKKLNESGLSRIMKTMQLYNTGFITANRHEFDAEENKHRNDALLIDLQRLFNVTMVKGGYIENYGQPNAVEVGENSFFVAEPDDKRTGEYIQKHGIDLKSELFKLGQKYNQDSVLYVPKGGTEGVLIGTKEGAFPGLNQELKLKNPVFGQDGQFVTRVKGRPFIFLSEGKFYKSSGPGNYLSNWARYLQSEKLRNGK